MSKDKAESNNIPEGEIVEHGNMHFTLGEDFGQLITDIAREKAWYQTKRADAVLLLMQDFGGITADQAERIIDGKSKLVTSEDGTTVELEDDNWTPPDIKKMKDNIRRILEWCSHAFERHPFDDGRVSWFDMLPSEERRYLRSEAEGIKDLMEYNVFKTHNRALVLEMIALSWMKENGKRWSEDIKEVRAKKGRAFVEQTLHVGEGDIMDELREDSKDRIRDMGLPPEQEKRMLELADNVGKDPDVEEDPKFEHGSGWLDREGKYWGCGLGLHIPLSTKLTERFYPEESSKNEERLLEKKGWMKCTGGQWWETDLSPTPQQLETCKQWSKKHKVVEYHYHEGSE